MLALAGMIAPMYREGFPSHPAQVGGVLWPFMLKVIKWFIDLYFFIFIMP